MDIIDTIKQRALARLQSIDYQQGLRLVINVGGYILIRRLVQRELAKKQLESQIKRDKKRKQNELIEKPEDDGTTTIANEEPTTFGWGNKTRYRNKKQQEMLGQAIDNLKKRQQRQNNSEFNADSDEDIADLLED